MSDAKHTPGPWCYEQVGQKSTCIVIGVTEPPVSGRFDENDYYDEETDTYQEGRPIRIDEVAVIEQTTGGYEDAALIASAPTLLAQRDALLKVAEMIYDICDNEGDGAPDDHPHTHRLLEFAGWLEPVIAKVKEKA